MVVGGLRAIAARRRRELLCDDDEDVVEQAAWQDDWWSAAALRWNISELRITEGWGWGASDEDQDELDDDPFAPLGGFGDHTRESSYDDYDDFWGGMGGIGGMGIGGGKNVDRTNVSSFLKAPMEVFIADWLDKWEEWEKNVGHA